MSLVKRITVCCVPFVLAACTTVHTPPKPEQKQPELLTQPAIKVEPKIEEKAKPQAKQKPIDSAAKAPAAVVTLLNRAEQQQLNGNFKAAGASLQRAIRIAPRYPESYYRLGELRFKEGLYSQARSLASKALSLGADWLLRMQAQSLLQRASAQ